MGMHSITCAASRDAANASCASPLRPVISHVWSQVRHETPAGVIGLWPEFTLLGHSCCPNTSATIVGDTLLMHAAVDVTPGERLAFNKIGR